MRPRIFADFNKVYGPPEKRCAILTCIGTVNDLKQQGLQLSEGMEVTLYQPDGVDANGDPDELEVDAVIELNDRGEWVGVFVFDELDYRSERRRQRE